MSQRSLVRRKAKDSIGRQVVIHTGEVTQKEMQRYAMAVGDPNPLYFDEQYAKKSGFAGVVGHPTFLSAVRQWGTGPLEPELDQDGTARQELLLPSLPVVRILDGGEDLEFFQPVRPGDAFTVTTKLVDIYEKKGRKGKSVFVVYEKTFENQRNEIATICRSTMITR